MCVCVMGGGGGDGGGERRWIYGRRDRVYIYIVQLIEYEYALLKHTIFLVISPRVVRERFLFSNVFFFFYESQRRGPPFVSEAAFES